MKKLDEDLGWNKKKLLILGGVFLILVFIALILLNQTGPQVKGEHIGGQGDSFGKVSNDLSQSVQDKVSSVQEDIRNLDVSEVATSSPQIQKVIKDIEAIQNLPASQAKDACLKVCSGL